MKDKPELKAWKVRIDNCRFCVAISDAAHPGMYWHYEDDREIVWRRWSTLWDVRPLHIESDAARQAIAASKAYNRRLRDEEQEEEAIGQWQMENPRLHEAMLSFVIALGEDDVPEEDQAAIKMLLGCSLPIYDRRKGLSAKEREHYSFAVGVHGPVDLVRRRLEFVAELAKADDSLAFLRDRSSAIDDSITWSRFVRMELTLRKRISKRTVPACSSESAHNPLRDETMF